MPKRKEHILSLSYGKDSLACLGAIKKLNWPLDRIIHVEVWATDKIPADLPPMVEFKTKADKWIFKNFGIKVEHIRAETTYEQCFYRTLSTGKWKGSIYGFPMTLGAWCNDRLKMSAMKGIDLSDKTQYLGIAADEPERIERNNRSGVLLPLVEAGWDEAYCRKWCEKHGLLSPIYTSSNRGGCWFCHNQGVDQLRLLRKQYPNLWALLLKWDVDSPVTFKSNGHTAHDYEIRFQLEDDGEVPIDHKFRWNMIEGED